jgi:hypothetical protein
MEQLKAEDLARELELVQADLQSLKLQQLRVKRAAEHVATGLRLLAKQQQARFGCD